MSHILLIFHSYLSLKCNAILGSSPVAQWVKDLGVAAIVVQVATAAWVQSLAWELSHAVSAAKKNAVSFSTWVMILFNFNNYNLCIYWQFYLPAVALGLHVEHNL